MEEQRKEEIEELEKLEETVQEEAGVTEPEEEQADNSAWKNKARPATIQWQDFTLPTCPIRCLNRYPLHPEANRQ